MSTKLFWAVNIARSCRTFWPSIFLHCSLNTPPKNRWPLSRTLLAGAHMYIYRLSLASWQVCAPWLAHVTLTTTADKSRVPDLPVFFVCLQQPDQLANFLLASTGNIAQKADFCLAIQVTYWFLLSNFSHVSFHADSFCWTHEVPGPIRHFGDTSSQQSKLQSPFHVSTTRNQYKRKRINPAPPPPKTFVSPRFIILYWVMTTRSCYLTIAFFLSNVNNFGRQNLGFQPNRHSTK